MNFLNNVLSGIPEFRQLYEAVSKERFPAMATGLSSVHKAHLIHHLCFHSGRRALVIAGDEAEASKLCADITSMGTKAVFYPARDFTFRNVEGASREFEHQRIGALWSFMSGESRVLVCCADAAVQYTIPKNTLKASTAVIKERILQVLLLCSFSYAVGIKTKLVNSVPPAADRDMTVAFLYSI